MIAALRLLFWLLVGHVVCDYPLQGDFMARAKNHLVPVPEVPAWLILLSHALVHAGMVALVTGSFAFAALEFVLHAVIDWLKCDGRTSFLGDQALHVICKALIVASMFRAGWV